MCGGCEINFIHMNIFTSVNQLGSEIGPRVYCDVSVILMYLSRSYPWASHCSIRFSMSLRMGRECCHPLTVDGKAGFSISSGRWQTYLYFCLQDNLSFTPGIQFLTRMLCFCFLVYGFSGRSYCYDGRYGITMRCSKKLVLASYRSLALSISQQQPQTILTI